MIPERVRAAPLFARGGWAVVGGLLDDAGRREMLREANAQLPRAAETRVERSDGEPYRGGNPARRFLTAPGGAAQREFYWARRTRELLASLAGPGLEPSGAAGTFTYYARPGDFIGIHRDIEICDVALITCLADAGDARGGNAGKMVFYPTRTGETNQQLRAEPGRGAVGVRLRPGESAVLFGGVLPHAVLPVGAGQARVVSVLCYRLGGV